MDSKIVSAPTPLATALDHDPIASAPAVTYVLRTRQLASTVSTTGAGGLAFQELAITRWRGDRTADAEGTFLYLRDLDSGEFWSAGYQPTLRAPTNYQVRLLGQSLEISRSDHQIDSTMSICLAADANVELRSCTLTNQGSAPRRLELTSYAELVLQDPQADAAHPAFSKLFVETAILDSGLAASGLTGVGLTGVGLTGVGLTGVGLAAGGLLTARRRPRQADDETVCAAHFLAGNVRADGWETDRSRFIGRGLDLSCPQAMQSSQPLSGTVGSVLDPVFSLRKRVVLAPGESTCVVFALAASQRAEDLLALATRYANLETVEKTIQAARDTPHEPSLLASENGHWRIDESTISSAEPLATLKEPTAAIDADNQHDATAKSPAPRAYRPASQAPQQPDHTPSADALLVKNGQASTEALQFDNGWGGFSADGTEYVIRVGPHAGNATDRPPMPWVNIIANRNLGFIVSESGAGYTWAGNSRLNRLTPWHNDPICDPYGEAFYIRDDQLGVFWSPTPGPVRQNGDYEVRHGFGYTKFLHTSHQLKQEVVQFVPREDAVKVTCVRLQNLSDQPRQLSLFSYHQWELSDGSRQVTQQTQTAIRREQKTIFATNDHRGDFSANVAYASLMSGQADGSPGQPAGSHYFSADRREFLGQNGTLANPLALQNDKPLSGLTGAACDPCAACQMTVEIPPGGTLDAIVLLGESPNQSEAEEVLGRYQTTQQCQQALTEVQEFWREKLSTVQIETPAPAIDLLVNGWLSYQNLSCRLWGRSSTYQSGGAYGFRDQLQDAAALVHLWPAITREQIIRNAAHQFSEGDVLHWWHTPASLGIRTTFSDDLLWLPLFAAEYVATTGDESLWQERVRFVTGPPVPAGAPEVMFAPQDSGEAGSVYEHCCRALDRGLTTGQHGLPLMGCGDWNDGMNRVGLGGSGESVWLGFFIDYILERMLPVCEQFDDQQRFERYTNYRQQLRTALNDAGWDGAWYRRAYFDDGSPLGTAESEECQIDALVQAWAVLSGAAPADRAAEAMASAEARLVDKQAGLIQLLDPPFDHLPQEPGYIKGYLPGIRENGGQYTHGVLWFIRAVAELGHGSRAVELLEMLSPINHARNAAEVNTYRAEPYVVAADVYSQAPHAGRAGWSWYTGSAGWMWRVAVESILGIGLVGGKTLRIDPRICADWPECRVRYRLADEKTVYAILIRNPSGRECGVSHCELNGASLAVENAIALVPLVGDGKTHQVVVTL